jgi:hypothetical protein
MSTALDVRLGTPFPHQEFVGRLGNRVQPLASTIEHILDQRGFRSGWMGVANVGDKEAFRRYQIPEEKPTDKGILFCCK